MAVIKYPHDKFLLLTVNKLAAEGGLFFSINLSEYPALVL
jgi:hypothetical protein